MTAEPPAWDTACTAATPPPWDISRPQPAFQRLAEQGRLAGRVLDAGCGTGEQTLLAAAHGADALGVDLSPAAIGACEELAAAFAAGWAVDSITPDEFHVALDGAPGTVQARLAVIRRT